MVILGLLYVLSRLGGFTELILTPMFYFQWTPSKLTEPLLNLIDNVFQLHDKHWIRLLYTDGDFWQRQSNLMALSFN